jgi:hypothetical protein
LCSTVFWILEKMDFLHCQKVERQAHTINYEVQIIWNKKPRATIGEALTQQGQDDLINSPIP